MGKRGEIFFFALAVSMMGNVLFSARASAIGVGDTIHAYVIPGIYGEDFPEVWVLHTHLRYVYFDKVYNQHGHKKGAGMEFSAWQLLEKFGHVTRFGKNDRWQLTDIVIVPLMAHIRAHFQNGHHFSTTGIGDILTTNYVGTWWKNHMIHAGIGFTLKFPTGDYNKHKPLNIGGNRWVFYFPFIHAQLRLPLYSGLLMIEPSMNVEWRYENHDTHFNDHDLSEWDLCITYWTSKDCRLGFFVQPNYQFAINSSSSNGEDLHDDDFYSFGSSFGITWNISSTENANLRWTRNFAGKGLDGGVPGPQTNAIHFCWQHLF